MIPPGLEPGTFRVLGERDNHYTTESIGHYQQLSNPELGFGLGVERLQKISFN